MTDTLRGRFSWERAVLDSDLDTTAKCLCLALASYTSPSQPTAWPSVGRLAADISRSERTVQRILATLQSEGWLVGHPRYSTKGRQTTTEYELSVPTPVTDEPDEQPQSSALVRVTGVADGEGVTDVTPEGVTHVTPYVNRPEGTDTILRYAQDGRSPVQRLIGWWVDRQAVAPSRNDVSKQAAPAKRLTDAHPPDHINLAIAGMVHVWPYSTGEEWDLWDLERVFLKAARAAVTNHPQFKKEYRRNEILTAIEEAIT